MEEGILDPAYKREPPTGKSKGGFERLMASTPVTVFFWFISFSVLGFCLFIGVFGREGDVSASCRGRDRLGGPLGAEGFTTETSVFIGVSSLPRGER